MSEVKQITLTYYKGLPGRCLPLQIAAELGGVTVVRDDVTHAEWFGGACKDRSRFPLGEIPIGVVERADGSKTTICETTPLLVLIGALSGLWPKDPVEQARAVQVLIAIETLMTGAPEGDDDMSYIASYRVPEGEARAEARKTKVTPRVMFYLGHVNDVAGEWVIGSSMTIVDIYVGGMFGLFTNPAMGGWIADGATVFPKIAAIAGKVFGNEKVAAIMARLTKPAAQ